MRCHAASKRRKRHSSQSGAAPACRTATDEKIRPGPATGSKHHRQVFAPVRRRMPMVKKPMAEPVSDYFDDELRLLGRIAAGVAHDLNNYLAVTDATFALLDTELNDIALIERGRASVDQARRLTASLV